MLQQQVNKLMLNMSSSVQKVFSRSRAFIYKGFTKNLLVSNTVTCSLLLTGGDLIQQRIERLMGYQQAHDYKRTGKNLIADYERKCRVTLPKWQK